MEIEVVVSNIFHVHPYLGKWSNLTNIFQGGWNHQLEILWHSPLTTHENRSNPRRSHGNPMDGYSQSWGPTLFGWVVWFNGGFKYFFHPEPWGNDPIWRSYFFRWVGKNHQLARLWMDFLCYESMHAMYYSLASSIGSQMHINTMSLDVLWVVQPPARSNHPSIFSVVFKTIW